MILSIQSTQKNKRRRILSFLKNNKKIKAIKAPSPVIHLERWARHFKHKYIIDDFLFKIFENT